MDDDTQPEREALLVHGDREPTDDVFTILADGRVMKVCGNARIADQHLASLHAEHPEAVLECTRSPRKDPFLNVIATAVGAVIPEPERRPRRR